jgi:hypothetical protein
MKTLIKKVLVKLGLARKTVPEKIEFGRTVKSAMTGNANFTNPSPTLVELETATDNLETAKNKAELGNHEAVQKMYDMEFEFDAVMTNMGKYVETTAKNNAAVILSAGMQIRNTPKGTKVPGQVVRVTATPVVNTQTVKVKWDAVEFALLYFVYQSTSIAGTYELKGQVTGTKFLAENLVAGTVYYWKIEARNGKGTGTQSDPMSAMAN